ncbi:hypothetical protein AMTR_s00010p00212030 [Amborella trichopoda]|uniref:Cytochrome P450 n=1 Tax=Amborella trichopoda TaxID=13333 RepID=W1NGB8_AMBTC|nr:hypothetical protein AMTR_s00010p00212030 [Amborella trichopoda]
MRLNLGGTAQALAASLLVAWVLIRILLHGTTTKGKLLLEPLRWPLIGHLHLLMVDKPLHRVLASLADCHGLIMKLRMGQKPTLVVSDADIARECLTTHDRAFASRPMVAAGRTLGFDYTAIAWATYGPLWRDLRKVCTLELLSTRRLETLSHVRDEESANCLKRLYSVWEARKEEGQKVQVGIRVDMVLEVIKKMVGGRSSLRLGPEEEVMEFKELVEEAFYVSGLGDVMAVLGWIDLQGSERAMKKLREKTNIISQLRLDERSGDRSLRSLHPHLTGEISYQVHTPRNLVYAMNSDTSAVRLEWALASLLSNPEAMRKVKEELDTKIGKERRVEEADIANLPYL